MANLFDTLEREAFRAGITPRTKESREWFRKKLQGMRRVNRNQLMKQEPITLANDVRAGAMVMFFYDPKTKDALPYYDSFPLTILVDRADDGFYGLNLHYLPPMLRAKFLDGLMDITDDRKITDKSKFAVTYQYLKRASGMKYFKPCFKKYLLGHMRSKFAVVPGPEWEIATFLPSADFQKASKNKVYSDSRKMING